MISLPFALLALAAISLLAQGSSTPLAVNVRALSPVLVDEVRRGLMEASLNKRDQSWQNSTSLDKSFNKDVLFRISATQKKGVTYTESISVTCNTCYTKGSAQAKLQVNGTFNATEAWADIKSDSSQIVGELSNWAETVVASDVKAWGEDIIRGDLGSISFAVPAPNISLDANIQAWPDSMLEFSFDNLEIYMDLDTSLSASVSYTVPLFRSEGLGVALTQKLWLGLIFSIDLILSSDADVAIGNGFHIQLDDTVLLKLALFSSQNSGIEFNGGRFEFLPVTVGNAGGTLKATLKMGLHAGFSLATPDVTGGVDVSIDGFSTADFQASVGVEARTYANLAEFVTIVKANPNNDSCAFQVAQEYIFAVGAAAGATVGLGQQIWGPDVKTEVPIWYTTLAEVCAASGTPTPTPTGAAVKVRGEEDIQIRDGLTVWTLSKTRTYTAVACPSSTACPASLQTYQETVATETLVTSVPSGVTPTWPAVTSSIVSTKSFGVGAYSMAATSGTPVSYVPGHSGGFSRANSSKIDQNVSNWLDGKTDGFSNKSILGIAVGLGVPIVMGLLTLAVIFCRRSKATKREAGMTNIFVMPGEMSPASPDISFKKASYQQTTNTYPRF